MRLWWDFHKISWNHKTPNGQGHSLWFSLIFWRALRTPKSSFCRTGSSHKVASWEEISGHRKTPSTAGRRRRRAPRSTRTQPSQDVSPALLETHLGCTRWPLLECSVLEQRRKCKRCRPAGRTSRRQRGNTERTTRKLWVDVKWLKVGPGSSGSSSRVFLWGNYDFHIIYHFPRNFVLFCFVFLIF